MSQPAVSALSLQYSSTVWPRLHAKQDAVIASQQMGGPGVASTGAQPCLADLPLQRGFRESCPSVASAPSSS
eukprot:CAMPEP_0170362362 /NCGR_PEP_ID=MMETSP0117_2-20130122/4293_1 /TAXON_ID=400756 /ORGANISM="Durinskia baltica, Strain CSIRO CS-38" /LENGTH=71 /DNA_ID=CAMNT_0010616777 /DNA_START=82 /DNA_END=294 /DNA_ORIENTATION=+